LAFNAFRHGQNDGTTIAFRKQSALRDGSPAAEACSKVKTTQQTIIRSANGHTTPGRSLRHHFTQGFQPFIPERIRWPAQYRATQPSRINRKQRRDLEGRIITILRGRRVAEYLWW
jgi:hypothetical protein